MKFAFVEMRSVEEASNAMALDGIIFENWYCYSKTVAEAEALEYAKKSGLNVITVCPALVLGPMLQHTANASSLALIKLLKESCDEIENNLRKIVDVRDVAEALILVYEKPEAKGRYICMGHLIKNAELVDMLKILYPNYEFPRRQSVDTPIDDRRLHAIEDHLTTVLRATTATEESAEVKPAAGLPLPKGELGSTTRVERRLHQLMLEVCDFDSPSASLSDHHGRTSVAIERCLEKGYSYLI